SGGEKRRLHLMTVLIKNPNFLILDEPTNDLDLLTLNKLEDFLLDYQGCLLIVSHDRYFMDTLVDHLFLFEGEGKIRDFNGTYSDYRDELDERAARERSSQVKEADKTRWKQNVQSETEVRKLSFKERHEFETLEKEISSLTQEKAELELFLNSGDSDYEKLRVTAERIETIISDLDEKELRWLELSEFE
ncbi:MAG: ATP-binding cassette subfamily F protein uup, partial [Bacteroidia bacterium]